MNANNQKNAVANPKMATIGFLNIANIMHKCSQNMVKAQVMNAIIKKTKNKYRKKPFCSKSKNQKESP